MLGGVGGGGVQQSSKYVLVKTTQTVSLQKTAKKAIQSVKEQFFDEAKNNGNLHAISKHGKLFSKILPNFLLSLSFYR